MKPQIDPNEPHIMTGAATVAPVVSVSGLQVAFGPKVVLDGIHLDINPGTAVALIGANGAGKSTLLRSLIRLVEPSAGSMRVLSQDVRGLNARQLRAFRSRIGVVFQRHNLVPRLSALTNVVHGAQARMRGPRTWLQSLAPAAVRNEALACLEAVGLADLARQRADSLSGGQSQRVAIARMLMQRPELVLADEPDASLDPKAGEEVMGLLYRLAKDKGLSLVVISHRIEHTTAFSDRIVGLVGGRIALETRSADAKAAELRAFFTDPHSR